MEFDNPSRTKQGDNRPIVTSNDVLQISHPVQFHIPGPVLAKIVSFVAADGVECLKPWIQAGREGLEAVYSPETLSQVRLDKSYDYAWWSDPISYFYPFFSACLQHKNPYALYIESLRLCFAAGDVHGALSILGDIKDISPVATLAYIIFCDCAGVDRFTVYRPFKRKYCRPSDVLGFGQELKYHIRAIGPRRCRMYTKSWHQEVFPVCNCLHFSNRTRNGDKCVECVYWSISLAVRHRF